MPLIQLENIRKIYQLDQTEVAALCGWSYNTARRALDELTGQELARVVEKGPPARYRLLDRSILGGVGQLVAPKKLRA